MSDCIFCKIVNKEMPAEILYESENVLVFPDIHPKAPTHLLIVPKKHAKEFTERNKEIFDEMIDLIDKIIRERNVNNNGYKIVINGDGTQMVDHFHIHLLIGGKTEEVSI